MRFQVRKHMIARGAKEILSAAHDQIERAWVEVCEAEGTLIKAKARLALAQGKYDDARKNWVSTVERCTPGPEPVGAKGVKHG